MAAAGGDAHTKGSTSARLWTRVQQMALEIAHDEAQYAALLVDSERRMLIGAVLVVLQMIEMPGHQVNRNSPHAEMVDHARDWAIDTLLDIHATFSNSADDVTSHSIAQLNDRLPVQQLQTALCTYSSLNASSHLVDEMQEAIFTTFALQQVQLKDTAFAQVLDLCAASMADDLKCALFLDAMLASRATFTVSRAFLDRLFKTESRTLIANASSDISSHNGDYGASPRAGTDPAAAAHPGRLFDQLSFISMVRLWGNHLPSWEAQLQEWLLQAHVTPFVPIASIVWRTQEGAAEPESASAAFQSYSYLYMVLLNWFTRRNSEFLVSPRSMELLALLSKCSRLSVDHRYHGRTLVHELGLSPSGESRAGVTLHQRAHAFGKAEQVLQTLMSKTTTTPERGEAMAARLQNEWMGLAERPRIVQEALELLFATPDEHQELEKHCGGDVLEAQQRRRGAAALIGWFYANLDTSNGNNDNATANSMAIMAMELASSLPVPDLPVGSAWLQQKRAEFQNPTQLCIKIAWFWLLKCCFTSADSIQNDAAVVEALENLEYVFRRFSPVKGKRSFQVEVVTQLLSDLEWRWKVVVRHQESVEGSKPLVELQERVDVPVAWLKKIVHLMQIEHHQRGASLPARATTPRAHLTLSEQLAVRLEHLFASHAC